jgi:hypothetical protein
MFSSVTGVETSPVPSTTARTLYEFFALDVFNGVQPWLNVRERP